MADNIVPINGSLTVIEQDGTLVVDSRLVAEHLGVRHKAFMQTIRKYLSEVQEFGHLPFKKATVTNSVGAVNEVVYCYLNEEQASYVMTLSRNTDQVRLAKRQLVAAFSQAKSVIKTVIPAQTAKLAELEAENRNMELKLRVYEAQQKTLAAAGLLAMTAPAVVEAIMLPGVTVIEKVEHIDRTVIVDTSGKVVSQLDGIGITAIQKQFGFKTTKAAWDWLESIGYGKESGHWQCEQTAHPTHKLPRALMVELRRRFAQHKGDRQRYLGE